jgi:2-dehydro-3-deoxygluconokinase
VRFELPKKSFGNMGRKASEIMPQLVAGCDLILGNEEDAEKVFGIKPEGFELEKDGWRDQCSTI